jgi:dCMP deaminase
MTRPTLDEYFITIANATRLRSTCKRRQVGCILVNTHGHIIGTGYNGVPSGFPHCIDVPCLGALSPSGTDLHLCEAIHAEINALIQCSDVQKIETIYCTTSPCRSCILALLNTSAKRIVFLEEYPHLDAKDKWLSAGREWEQFKYGR